MAKVSTTIVSFNGHVGQGLRSFALRWVLLRNILTSIVLVQEGRGVEFLKKNLGRRFRHFPLSQPGDHGRDAMTYVAWLRARYRFVEGWNYDIRHDSVHARRMTAVLLKERLTKKMLLVVTMHPDPMGLGWEAPRPVVRRHQLQMKEYLDFIEDIQKEYPGIKVIAGGDLNERLQTEVPENYQEYSALHGLKRLGLKPAHLGSLDGIWTSTGGEGRSIDVPREGMDHSVAVATTKI